MSDPSAEQSGKDRRRTPRYRGSASARVIRDSDAMRVGIEGELKDVSIMGIGVLLEIPLDANEQIKVQLTNYIQRVNQLVRGVVRHATPTEDGRYHIGVELFSRLTPLDVSLLRMGMARDEDEEEEPRLV